MTGDLCLRLLVTAAVLTIGQIASAGEGPFFVTYTHQMEEPGNLELATKSVIGSPRGGDRFLGATVEFEYGVKAWWTSEFYLDGQATRGESAVFTGYRWENRFRLLPREHWLNPVLYIEFENINDADKSLLEIVNHDGNNDLTSPNAEARFEKKREIEAKLILGSYFRGWTIAENFIAEKNVKHAPFEFGYAVGISRPLALAARPDRCNFCAENVQVGVEIYGGLGTHEQFGIAGTSHYLAPTVHGRWPTEPHFEFHQVLGSPGTAPDTCCGLVSLTKWHNSAMRRGSCCGEDVSEHPANRLLPDRPGDGRIRRGDPGAERPGGRGNETESPRTKRPGTTRRGQVIRPGMQLMPRRQAGRP
jgi:hypothetical protein